MEKLLPSRAELALNYHPDYLEGHEITTSMKGLLYISEKFGEKTAYDLMTRLFDETDIRRNVIMLVTPFLKDYKKGIFEQLKDDNDFKNFIDSEPTLTEIIDKAKKSKSIEDLNFYLTEYQKRERKFMYKTWLPAIYSRYYLEPLFKKLFSPYYPLLDSLINASFLTINGISYTFSRELLIRFFDKIGKHNYSWGKKLFKLERNMYKYLKLSLSYFAVLCVELALGSGININSFPLLNFGLGIIPSLNITDLLYWIYGPYLFQKVYKLIKREKLKNVLKGNYKFVWNNSKLNKIKKYLLNLRFPISKKYYLDFLSFKLMKRIDKDDIEKAKNEILDYMFKMGYITEDIKSEISNVDIKGGNSGALSGAYQMACFLPNLIFVDYGKELELIKDINLFKVLSNTFFDGYDIKVSKNKIVGIKKNEKINLVEWNESRINGILIDKLLEIMKSNKVVLHYNPLKKRFEYYYPQIFIWDLLSKEELNYYLFEEISHLLLLLRIK
jgi:hypothetical protein